MAIKLNIARTETEVDDALWVRHEVFVIEDGRFGGKPLLDERIVDRFDAFPDVYNIVAYEGDEPIATMRVVIRQHATRLPANEYYDFSHYQREAETELLAARGSAEEMLFATAGMLAVRGPWRARRDVIRAMFKVAAGITLSSKVTHVAVAVNHDTTAMYRRLGLVPLADKIWIEHVGNHIVPLAAPVQAFHDWAFGDLPRTPLDSFKDRFERLFVRAGENVFVEGESGEYAYIVDWGTIRISRRTPFDQELTLAHLQRGDLFGELAMVDMSPRSATATAMTDAELITLGRDDFLQELYQEPRLIHQLLEVFSARLRKMDDFAVVLAFSAEEQRLEFALRMVQSRAVPDRKDPSRVVFRGGPLELAHFAAVTEEAARAFLAKGVKEGRLAFTDRSIDFLREFDARPEASGRGPASTSAV